MRPLAVLGLLFLSATAGAFSGYSPLLQEPGADLSALYLQPLPCGAFLESLPPLAEGVLTREGFESARAEALLARASYASAQASARVQQEVMGRLPGTGVALAVERLASRACFAHGLQALAHGVRANHHALSALEKQASALEQAAGEEPHPLARAALLELQESRRDLDAGRAEGRSFGARWLANARDVQAAGAALRAGGSSSAAKLVAALRSLVGPRTSSLALTLGLEGTVRRAHESLRTAWRSTGSRLEEAGRNARSAIEEVERERLESVDESAFLLVGGGSSVAGEHNLSSFSQEGRDARAQLAESEVLAREASSEWESEEQGHASRALNFAERALLLAQEARTRASRASERARSLEAELQGLARREAERLRLSLREQLSQDAFAAARAQETVRAFEQDSEGRSLATRGARITFFARSVTELRDARRWLAEASAWAAERQLELQAEAERLGELLKRAEKDGLSIQATRLRLGRVKEALSGLSSLPEGPRGQALLELEGELEAARNNVLWEAEARYAELLEGLWSRVSKVRWLLPAEEQARLSLLEAFFDGDGSLKTEEALGSLKSAKESLVRAWAAAEARAPALLKRHLEETARVEWFVLLAGLGERVNASIQVELRNSLPLAHAGILELDFPALAGVTPQVVRSSRSLSAGAGVLFLSGIQEGEHVRAELSWQGVVAELRSQERGQVGEATVQEARFRTRVRFNAAREALVRVGYEVPYIASLAASSARPLRAQASSGNPSSIEALVDARAGENEVVVEESVAEPFRVQVLAEAGSSNHSLALRVRFEGAVTDLVDAVHTHAEPLLPCSDARIETSAPAGARAEASQVGGVAFLRLHASRLTKGAMLDFPFSIRCNGLGRLALQKIESGQELLEEARGLGSQAETHEASRALEEARALLEGGDARRALPLAYNANELLAGVLKGASERAARQAGLEQEAGALEQELEEAASLESVPEAQSALSRARESLRSARSELTAGQLVSAEAWLVEARRALAGLVSVLRERLTALAAECTFESCRPAQEAYEEAQLHLAGRAWSAFSEALERGKQLAAQAIRTQQQESERVRGLLEGVPALREQFRAALSEFERAFEVDASEERERKVSEAYLRGQRAQRSGSKELAELERAWEQWQKAESVLGSLSGELLTARSERVRAAAVELEDAAGRVRQDASSEISLAKQRAPGGSEAARAEEALGEGRAFTAWLLARGAGRAAAPAEGGGEGLAWGLGAAAAAILIVLAWVFSRGPKQPELRDVD